MGVGLLSEPHRWSSLRVTSYSDGLPLLSIRCESMLDRAGALCCETFAARSRLHLKRLEGEGRAGQSG